MLSFIKKTVLILLSLFIVGCANEVNDENDAIDKKFEQHFSADISIYYNQVNEQQYEIISEINIYENPQNFTLSFDLVDDLNEPSIKNDLNSDFFYRKKNYEFILPENCYKSAFYPTLFFKIYNGNECLVDDFVKITISTDKSECKQEDCKIIKI